MIVVVASAWDEQAATLADDWKDDGVCLLTPLDLSRPGWTYRSPCAAAAAVLGGEVVLGGKISGVLTRLGWITEHEIPHIAPTDRAYVAAEMHSFLFAWLSRLACPMLNRPTPYCLAGPSWRNEKWIHLAASLGMRVQPMRRTARLESPAQTTDVSEPCIAVTVAGERWAGDERMVERTRALAAAAGLQMLTACYREDSDGGEPSLATVSLWSNLGDRAVRSAIRGCLLGQRALA